MDKATYISSRYRLRALLIGALLLLSGCQSELQKIKEAGVLKVATRNTPTTYYEERDGAAGFEYELISLFAQDLGVRLEIDSSQSFDGIFQSLSDGKAHLAAAGLSITPERQQAFRFGPAYMEVTPQVIYLNSNARPRSLQDLVGRSLAVVAGSSHAEYLRAAQRQVSALSWQETSELEVTDLLTMVDSGDLDYAVIDSNELAIHQAYHPRVQAAFPLSDPLQLAWAMPRGSDISLYSAVKKFFQRIQTDGTLQQLQERYYGHVNQLNYVGARRFLRHANKRLPRYKQTFQQAAEQYGLDWRLLAAQGYQESHWRARAVSPTGVKGLMMLTLPTAREMGVKSRLNPTQSIFGGARYLSRLKQRLPDSIQEPDRTWFALAAYNVGYGHLQDARLITEQQGFDPDKWVDVKKHLPLLRQRAWYRHTKHGYARGDEPVLYVQNIRRYYDVLVWMQRAEELASTDKDAPEQEEDPKFSDVPPVL